MNIKIKQRDITDCGAACLASIAAYYKVRLPVSRIRQFACTDKKGTNISGLIEAADKMGFLAKGVEETGKAFSKYQNRQLLILLSKKPLLILL